jgi:histidine kinase
MERFKTISFKNKIFFSTLFVILLLSIGTGVATRLVLLPTLTEELKQRGLDIAQSLAHRSKGYILSEDKPNLVSLAFDTVQLGERRLLIAYIVILDKRNNVLSHTFLNAFPEKLRWANVILPEQNYRIRLLHVKGNSAYDIGVPIVEGIYRIGTVHVGLYKKHLDHLTNKLTITFIAITSVVILIIGFLVSHWLSGYITRPISQLIKAADQISRGNLDIQPYIGSTMQCWEIQNCKEENCPAYHNLSLSCWYIDSTKCPGKPVREFPEKLQYCQDCEVYRRIAGDEITQLADSFRNMTWSLKVSQDKLKESEEKYRALFDSGPNPIFVLDPESFEILDANPSAEQTYGYSKQELLGRPFTDLGPLEYVDADLLRYKENSEPKACIVSQKVRHYKRGNITLYVNISACGTRFKDRDAMIIAATDITEMMEKDAQLIQASKMAILGEMSAGMAHELNQPLNAIKMGNEFLKMMAEEGRKIPEQDLLQVVDEVSTQVDRAAEIINRLREFGRKADFTKERVYINRPIRNVIAIVGQQLGLQNIKIKLNLDETIAPIWAHNNRLEQVFFNLVTNARDAINEKEETGSESGARIISIRSFREGGFVAVTVSDTGIGIPESVKDKIFEPFFTTKEAGHGLGLGLSITYGIVKDYDGEISVQTEEGKGTVFKLTFPSAAVA